MTRWTLGILILGLVLGGCGDSHRDRVQPLLDWSPETMGELEPQIRRQFDRALATLESRSQRSSEQKEVADAAGQLGMLHHVYQNNEQALLAYELAEEFDKAEPRWPYYRGFLLAKVDRDSEAIEAYRAALEIDYGLIPARMRLVELQVASGDLAEATTLLESLPRPVRQLARSLTVEAELALAVEDFERAAELLARARELEPRSNRIRLGLGESLRGLGRMEEARTALAGAGAVTVQDAELDLPDPLMAALYNHKISSQFLWELGRNHLEAGRVDEALVELRRALKIAPDRESFLTDYGTALASSGDMEGALVQFGLALDKSPQYLPALAALGKVQSSLKLRDEAIATYQRLLAIDDIHPGIHLELGNLYRVDGRFDEAAEHYRRVIDLEPSIPQAYVWLGWIQYLEGSSQGCLETFQQGLRQIPDSNWLAALELRVAASLQDMLGASELLVTAQREAVRVPVAFNAETVAMLYARAGDFNAARQWQQAALAAAGSEAGTAAMGRRMEDYRKERLTREVLDRDDPGAADVPLRREDLEMLTATRPPG